MALKGVIMNKLKLSLLVIIISAFSLGKSVCSEGSKNNSKLPLFLLANADDHDDEWWEERESNVLLGGD